MQQQSRNRHLWVKICLLLLCLILTCSLVIGVTFGRYRQEFPPVSYPFVADGQGTLILGGVVTQDWIDKGTWPAVPTDWTADENKAQLDFSISNGKAATDFTQRNQTAVVRLVTGLGIGAPENLTVELTFDQNDRKVTLIGQAEKVNDGSLIHQNYGPGWIYRFYDITGSEMAFPLTGGKLSYQNLTVTLTGQTDPILCQLQVLGSYTD